MCRIISRPKALFNIDYRSPERVTHPLSCEKETPTKKPTSRQSNANQKGSHPRSRTTLPSLSSAKVVLSRASPKCSPSYSLYPPSRTLFPPRSFAELQCASTTLGNNGHDTAPCTRFVVLAHVPRQFPSEGIDVLPSSPTRLRGSAMAEIDLSHPPPHTPWDLFS